MLCFGFSLIAVMTLHVDLIGVSQKECIFLEIIIVSNMSCFEVTAIMLLQIPLRYDWS